MVCTLLASQSALWRPVGKLQPHTVPSSPLRSPLSPAGTLLAPLGSGFVSTGSCLQEGSIYDYLFDKSQCGWRHWMDTVPVQEVPISAAFHEIIMQTIETVRYTYLLNMLVSHGYHTLFTGGPPVSPPVHSAVVACQSVCQMWCMPGVAQSCRPVILLHLFCCSCCHPAHSLTKELQAS